MTLLANPTRRVRSASSGRQAQSREVYNPLQSWSPRNRGAHTGEAFFDRGAASDSAGLRHVPVL